MTALVHGGHVHANGIRQHYLRFGGRGQPLVLIPGITSPAISWAFVAEELARRFDVYVLDVRGRGLSEAGAGLDYSLNACADDVIAFAAALKLSMPLALGHSMGARHLVRAMRRGGQFERIVLADPPVSGPGRRPYPTPLNWYIDSMELARRGADMAALRPFTPTWTDAEIALRAEWLHTCEDRAIRASFASFHEDDIHEDLKHLRCRTLLLAAGRGNVILEKDISEIRKLLPTIAVQRIEAAGHMIPWDDLRSFLQAVGAFLTDDSSAFARLPT
jgi:N-formylmaleamate deformylase